MNVLNCRVERPHFLAGFTGGVKCELCGTCICEDADGVSFTGECWSLAGSFCGAAADAASFGSSAAFLLLTFDGGVGNSGRVVRNDVGTFN